MTAWYVEFKDGTREPESWTTIRPKSPEDRWKRVSKQPDREHDWNPATEEVDLARGGDADPAAAQSLLDTGSLNEYERLILKKAYRL